MTLQQYLSTLPCLLPRESPNPIPVHSLMLSSHLFFCLPLLLAPFTAPCRIVFDMPENLEMWQNHLSFLFFTMVRRSSCTPMTLLPVKYLCTVCLHRCTCTYLANSCKITLNVSNSCGFLFNGVRIMEIR